MPDGKAESVEAGLKRVAQECVACSQVLTQCAALAQIHAQASSPSARVALGMLLSEVQFRVSKLAGEFTT